jgi:phosphopantothenate-cysteine ligase/phosphopantothenoylcysteine decarboxylase/phosphopantothenate--cysteine ligase
MKILVTAGNTLTPVDRVRCITNIFSGRTGTQIAARAFDRGHTVTLLTSHPEVLDRVPVTRQRSEPGWRVRPYRTYDDLDTAMAEELTARPFDVVIHAAAVSDYRVVGIYTRTDGEFAEVAAGKVKSSYPELWFRLMPTPKLVDKLRTVWGFSGVVVKFKLEVGLTEAELLEVAEQARLHSAADLMVANTLDGMHEWALVGAGPGSYQRVTRDQLPDYLLGMIESAKE